MFDTNLHALVTSRSQLDALKDDVRRLSTRGIMTGDTTKPSFQTQWRWYFVNDQNNWDKFEKVCMFEQFTVLYLRAVLFGLLWFKFLYSAVFSDLMLRTC